MTTTQAAADVELLRLSTAGSVDDGKSTLIGRLLYETKSIFQDQLEEVERASINRGSDYVNLALLTDGLRAEREQGITIDVAYRYFATPRRKFIVADTPGHVQYTRNMVTGTSTANVAITLLDAARGITEQSRRHVFIASLMRVPHVVVCVNKMDLAGYDEARYNELKDQFLQFCTRLDIPDLTFIPISALRGDNVVERSAAMPWYGGTTLLYYLENVQLVSERDLIDVRFPVQWVNRPMTTSHHDYRGYAGQVAGGVLKPGDELMVLPSGFITRVRAIETYEGPIEEAFPPMSVTLLLEDDLDISRGDMLCRPNNQPHASQDIEATICWMSSTPMREGAKYSLQHTTRSARALVKDVRYRIDVNTLHRDETASGLQLNEIGRVALRTTVPLFFDAYSRNRATGSFILLEEGTNETVGAGMILDR